jgi:hypothetical protein
VRRVAVALRGGRHADFSQQLDGPHPRFAARHVAMCPDRLGDLAADRVRRVERALRILHDHRHLVATQAPALLGVERAELTPLEADRAARRGAGGQQPHHGGRQRRLAAARLPDEAQRLARCELETDAGDCRDRPAVRTQVVDADLVEREQAHDATPAGS